MKVQVPQQDNDSPDSAMLFKPQAFKQCVFQQCCTEAKSKGKTH